MRIKLILFALFIIGLSILSTFKTVWIDETYMAELTFNLLNGNGFQTQAAYFAHEGQPIYLYGPTYFLLTLLPVKLGGLDPFWFRLTNYIAYFGVILLFLQYFIKRGLPKWTYLLPILLFLDPSAFENAVSGRMEAVCLFFAVLAYFQYISIDKKSTYTKYLWIGLFIILSYLTTPRAVLLFIPLGFLVIRDLIIKKNFSHFTALLLAFISPLAIWIFFIVGSIDEFIGQYTNGTNFHSGDKTAVEAYLMGGFKLNAYKIVLYSILIVSYFIPKTLNPKEKVLNYSFSFVAFLFLFLVKDVGSYFAYVSPLITFIIFLNFQNSTFKFSHLTLIGLTSFNILIFGLKLSYNLINDNKTYDHIVSMVDQHIPEETRVITNYEFYYPLRKKSLDLYYLQFGKDPESRIQYYIDNVNPEYILTTKGEVKMELFNKDYTYKIIAEYPNVPTHHWIEAFYYKLGNFFRIDYKDLAIYKLTPKS